MLYAVMLYAVMLYAVMLYAVMLCVDIVLYEQCSAWTAVTLFLG